METGAEPDPLSKGEAKLPNAVMRDGAKWLIMPSKIILDSLSVWPEHSSWFTKTLNVLCLTSFALAIFGHVIFVSDKEADLGSIAYAISILILSIETMARRVLLNVYRVRLIRILSKVYFEFWPSNFAGSKLHSELSQQSWYLFLYCAAYMFSAFVCGIQYILLPYSLRNLPLRTAYPFAWRESPYYELLYAWQSFLSLEVVFNICGVDLFFVSLLFNCVAQFKLLRVAVQRHFRRALRKGSLGDSRTEARRMLYWCITRHNRLISACKEIEDVFTYFILVQYLTSMGTVCLSSFVATAVPEDLTTALTYLLGHICEILIYCYMGHDLILESTELSNAVFQCGWHLTDGDSDLQKSFVLIMVRSQKPVKMSAGGFGFLSLQSFVKLIQFSFSVYTLLNSMMKKQHS